MLEALINPSILKEAVTTKLHAHVPIKRKVTAGNVGAMPQAPKPMSAVHAPENEEQGLRFLADKMFREEQMKDHHPTKWFDIFRVRFSSEGLW